ncbi:MAG: hypothetical protein LBQ24_06360 [Candidatus Peribacteria bacterium]|jgi:hypothetical protein|nr:hypothetical protein [Candidatus Peribacteria bacterium]
MNLYDDKVKETKKEVSNAKPIDVNSQVLDLLSQTKEKELKIIVYINQSILNFLMNYKSILTNMANTFHNKEFFEVIL